MITFVSDTIPETTRLLSGFYSLDKAAGDGKSIGFPIRTMTEIFGPAGLGKTTVMLSLGAIFAKQLGGNIGFADFEGQSLDTVRNSLAMQGFGGEVDLLRTGADTQEDVLDNMIEAIQKPEYNVTMLDSIGAFSPVGEIEGSVADANMGAKARIIGNWIRKMNAALMRKNGVCIYVSHQHPNMGFAGVHTSGGETKGFMNAVQIELKRSQGDEYGDGWLLEGRIRKNRFGKKDSYFHIFVIGGRGAHTGLSAIFDCVGSGLATIDRKAVKMDGVTYGRVARLVEQYEDESLFVPFFNALKSMEVPTESQLDGDEDAPAEETPKPTPKRRGRKPKK